MHLVAAAEEDAVSVEHHLSNAPVLRARAPVDDRELDVGRARTRERVLPGDGRADGIGGCGGEADDLASLARTAEAEKRVHRWAAGIERAADQHERTRLAIVAARSR